jgi:glycosyltransferase involved in cell wall biosynthesis
VTYWVIDFVPDRFGAGSPATRAYDRLDRAACLGADLRVELSAKARDARNARHDIRAGQGSPVALSPIGAWTSRVPTTTALPPAAPRLIYSGGLHERQGILVLPGMLARVRASGVDATLVVTGRGPDESALRTAIAQAGVADAVEMRGFLPEYRQVEDALASASIAVAPYVPDPTSFSNFSVLSKLKAYAAAGLPILTTSVPHNAAELAASAGAEVLPCDAVAFADAVVRLAHEPLEWSRRRQDALTFAAAFDWNTLLDDVVGRIVSRERR